MMRIGFDRVCCGRHYGKTGVLLLGLAMAMAGPRANAVTVTLGTVSSATGLGYGNDALSGEFEDIFNFTIAAGLRFEVSTMASTGFSRISGIGEFAGDLSGGEGTHAVGASSVRYLPEGFPAYDVSFTPVVLEAGDYALRLSGNAVGSYPGVTAGYSGVLRFDEIPASIAEPNGLWLVGLAMAGLQRVRRRRRH